MRDVATTVAFRFLNRADVERLLPPVAEVLDAVEAGLAAHGRGRVVLPPKSHIHLDDRFNGHFNVLPGYVEPIGTAGVKVVGDFVDNWRRGLPSEVALLTLYDPATGGSRRSTSARFRNRKATVVATSRI